MIPFTPRNLEPSAGDGLIRPRAPRGACAKCGDGVPIRLLVDAATGGHVTTATSFPDMLCQGCLSCGQEYLRSVVQDGLRPAFGLCRDGERIYPPTKTCRKCGRDVSRQREWREGMELYERRSKS